MSTPKFNQNQNVWEIDVPGDNSCLFWAVALAFLIPVKDNHDDFQDRFKRLFGKKSLGKLEHIEKWIKDYNPFPVAATITYQDKILNELVKTKFRLRVIYYIEHHESQYKGYIEGNFADYLNSMRNCNSWGGEPEIRAISDLLDCSIQVISAGQEHNYGDVTLIQLFHVESLPDSPAANHYHFGLEKSQGDTYQ